MNTLASVVAIVAALLAGSAMLVGSRLRRTTAQAPTANRDSLPISNATRLACAGPGCGEQPTWACQYRTQTGQRCDNHLCKNHVVMVGTSTYCLRHAGVSKALNRTEGSIYQVKTQPHLEDRALSLLDLIRQNVDPALQHLLAEAAAGLPGVEVAAQKQIQEIQSGSDRIGWQVSWGLYTSRGYLLKALIRVGVPEPPVVEAVVANAVVFLAVPYWVTTRLNGEPPAASDHQMFYADLIRAMHTAVQRGVAQVSAQHEFESERFGSKKSARY